MPVANDLENGKESGTLFEDKAIILRGNGSNDKERREMPIEREISYSAICIVVGLRLYSI